MLELEKERPPISLELDVIELLDANRGLIRVLSKQSQQRIEGLVVKA